MGERERGGGEGEARRDEKMPPMRDCRNGGREGRRESEKGRKRGGWEGGQSSSHILTRPHTPSYSLILPPTLPPSLTGGWACPATLNSSLYSG